MIKAFEIWHHHAFACCCRETRHHELAPIAGSLFHLGHLIHLLLLTWLVMIACCLEPTELARHTHQSEPALDPSDVPTCQWINLKWVPLDLIKVVAIQ